MRRSFRLLSAAAATLSTVGLMPQALAAAAMPVTPTAGTGSPPAATGQQAVPNELVVTYVNGVGTPDRERARGRAGAKLAERVVPGAANRAEVELVRLPAGSDRSRAVRELEADPAVAVAEPNWVYTTTATSSDPFYTNGTLWGMYGPGTSPANQYGSNAAAAWAAGRIGSTTVYVGVIDEGIQYTHPDLSGQVRNPKESWSFNGIDDDKNGYVDDVYGWDFASNNRTVYDGGTSGKADDHGTHVAGTIGAKANSSGVVGVNWNVRIISGKFLGPNGGTLSNAVKAVDYFTNLKKSGVNIVATNNSWGGGGYSQALADAIQRANTASILFVAAAGNGGSDGVGDNNDITPSYPASYTHPNVISVAAITKTGSRASFSNFGVTSVDIGAPGAAITSTTAYNGYSSYSGTSMATPHVTGAAALYAATKQGSSAATIRTAILNSAVPTASLNGATSTGGRLDVNGALSK